MLAYQFAKVTHSLPSAIQDGLRQSQDLFTSLSEAAHESRLLQGRPNLGHQEDDQGQRHEAQQ